MRKFCNKIGVYSKKGKIKKPQVLEQSKTSIRFQSREDTELHFITIHTYPIGTTTPDLYKKENTLVTFLSIS